MRRDAEAGRAEASDGGRERRRKEGRGEGRKGEREGERERVSE